ncbi:MAG: nitroreductase family protein [Absicoccus sp.]|uniref:Nitroreductase family protein n=1 Tax=Absicoccus intestinalis TaxID=2926319 RepID=A0ABU4WL22_9FIRM|nr:MULTISPECIES: nitroreductase family protein [unclassified Absicoccus]MDX8416245.1 nitroreductase family protein [Absicoccus sp. CLA-KB-P134]MDY3036477.1 nitroreductase family protein [Absicoccus sp.]
MNTKDVLEQRRSIRKFKPGSITKDQMEELVHASQMAPSWKNSQTARYYVATSEEGMNKIRAGLPERNAHHTIHAAALFVMTFKKDRSGFMQNGSPDNEVGNGWGFYDNGLATENLLLKAYDMGFGTIVMGIRDEQILREQCQIPADEIITSVIALGIPDIHPTAPKRKEVSEIITYVDGE